MTSTYATISTDIPSYEAIHRRMAFQPPRMPSAPPGDTDGTESYLIQDMPSRDVDIHSPHPNTPILNLTTSAKDCKCDKDSIADLLSTLSAAWKYR